MDDTIEEFKARDKSVQGQSLRINHIKKGTVEKETVGRGTNDYEEETEGNIEARGRMYVKNWGIRVG